MLSTIHRLRDVLSRVLASPDDSINDQELFDELMVQKVRLLKVFDVGPRNSQEQKEIESGSSLLICLDSRIYCATLNRKADAEQQVYCREW